MSPVSVEGLRAVFDRWNSGERSGARLDLDTIHPDCEINSRLSSVKGEPYRGHEGVRQWQREIDEQFSKWRIEMDEIRHLDGDRFLAVGRVHLRGRGSEVEFAQPLGWIIEARDGLWSRMTVYASPADAIEAAGVSL